MITISKHHKLVLLAAVLFAAGSTIFLLFFRKPAAPREALYYKSFKTDKGWGYDILFKDRIIIHQPFVGGASGYDGYPTEKAAADDAQTVIESIKSGHSPLPIHQ